MRSARLLPAVLALLALTAVALDGSAPVSALRAGADAVLGPSQRGVGRAVDAVVPGRRAGSPVSAGPTDAGLLRADAELHRLLSLRTTAQYPVVPARVVARGGALGFADTAVLDVGSRDGVRAGQTVLTADGLVGRTVRVGPLTCSVLLLVDPGSTVGGRLDRLGGVGLVDGEGADRLRFELVDAQSAARVGDLVTTSGSGTFVPDVPVGRVVRLVPQASSLTRVAELAPLARLAALDVVGVVVGPVRTGVRRPLA